jgi:DNA repair protein RadD
VTLRDYQQRTLDELYAWFEAGNKGNPCIVLPTGSGKSHIIAALCKNALQSYPETRILMLTHVRELILQNAEKMLQHWPNAPLGIFSASLRRKNLEEPITFAGIQSIRARASEVGHIDLILIDECHLVSHKDEGGYRKLIGDLMAINPRLRVIGLTATPYRLGHGLITDKPALFDALLEPISIEQLVFQRYLAPLRSKTTKAKLNVDGVHKRGGEFIESELQAAVDNKLTNEAVVREVITRAEDRKAWLFFCTGVDHAKHMAETLQANGIEAACVTGETPKRQREEMLEAFKAGKIRAMTNANVLTTGFDYPDIDLIAMVRPTMSASLYVQMAGRGMRPKSHTDHCIVLDFAGVVETHGPIIAVRPPKKKGDGDGEAPVKVCDNCGELCHPTAKICQHCGNPFPLPEPKQWRLSDVDIMGLEGLEMAVTSWRWRKHTSRTSGKDMLAVTYYGDLSDPTVTEYLTVGYEGYAGQKAARTLSQIAERGGIKHGGLNVRSIDEMADNMNACTPPMNIEYRQDGKFHRVIRRNWNANEKTTARTGVSQAVA